MNQTSIFDIMYPKYKITKPIRLIELFGGYGSQALALKYLGVEFEHWKLVEWAVKSIQAYKDIHFTNNDIDYSYLVPKEELEDILFELGISQNYNEPMTKQQIQRLNEKQVRTIYNNICATNNLVNIQQVKGKDLEIENTDKYEYIMTYSFPCQDLSLAGKGKGMSDTSTRSGLLWEVERILTECKELGSMPQILLMENVPQVHSLDNMPDFHKWQVRLEELGYKSYWQDLIATDYGIPQTRNRCFMVSILGDYSYTFPKPIPLKLKLKDMLEEDVDEKYYLSGKQIESLESGVYNASKPSEKLKITDKGLCQTLDTMSGGNRQPLVRVGNKSLQETLKQNNIKDTCYIDTYNRRIDEEKSGTITTGVSFRNNQFLAIKNANAKGYLEATDGDGIDISSRMQYPYGTVQKGKSQTLTTSGGENNGVVVLGNYSKSNHNASRIIDQEHLAPTVMENHGTITAIIEEHNKNAKHQQDMVQDSDGNARTLVCGTHGNGGHYTKTMMSDLRIRKLTPRECGRLQGVKDSDIDKINLSDSAKYHIFGDAITVPVLCAIFGELIGKDYKSIIERWDFND